MNIQKSLYESILDGVQNGALPEDFSLPQYETEGGFSFGDGAKDGVTIFHMQQTDIDDSGMAQLIKALHLASEGKAAEADAAFAELGRSFGAVLVIDDLQQYILLQPAVRLAGIHHQPGNQMLLCKYSGHFRSTMLQGLYLHIQVP